MPENELFNILNPNEAHYMSLPPVEKGPIQLANIPRFQNEPKPYSVNTNAMGLLGRVLSDIIQENTLRVYLDDFSAQVEFPGPGASTMNVGYNIPSGLGYNNDWAVGATVPVDF